MEDLSFQLFSVKRKSNVNLHQHLYYFFSNRRKEKKMAISQVEGC